jgi:dipeptidyl aminopeptidase/acylaminoacyl peptidase
MMSKLNQSLRQLGLFATIPAFIFTPMIAQAAPRTPVEAFAALPTFANLAISRDGDTIAFGATAPDGNLGVKIYNFSSRTSSAFSVGKYKLRDIRFEDGGKVLITISEAEYYGGVVGEAGQIVAVDLVRKTVRSLGALNLVSTLPNAPDLIASARYDNNSNGRYGFSLNLYSNNLKTGRVQLLEYGREGTYDWLADNNGKPIARADLDLRTKTNTLWLRNDRGVWREGVKITDTVLESISLLGFLSDGRILFSRRSEDQISLLQALNPATDEISTVPIARLVTGAAPEIEVEDVQIDDTNQQVLGISVGGLIPQVRWSNPDLIAAQSQLEAQFPNKVVEIIEFTPDFQKVIAAVQSLTEPEKYLILDVPRNQITPIGSSMPTLENVTMGQLRSTTFKSRDGVDIPVYVTTPPGHPDPKNAPTIVFPHGGPASRDAPEFDWWAQFMASRG